MSSLTARDSRCFSICSISISFRPPSNIEVFQLSSSSSFALISARVKQSSSSSAESIEENITPHAGEHSIQPHVGQRKTQCLFDLNSICFRYFFYHVCISQPTTTTIYFAQYIKYHTAKNKLNLNKQKTENSSEQ